MGKENKKNVDVFRMCLSLYDYQSKASRYSNGLTYLKTRVFKTYSKATKNKKKRTQT